MIHTRILLEIGYPGFEYEHIQTDISKFGAIFTRERDTGLLSL